MALGPVFSLVTAARSCDPEACHFIAVEVGRDGAEVWLWNNLPNVSLLKANSPNDWFL